MTVRSASIRKAKKLAKRAGAEHSNTSSIGMKNSLSIQQLRPRTDNQKLVFDGYYSGKNLLLSGLAGTGKTYISIGLALNDLVEGNCTQEKLVIVRSVVPTRDVGFLPGSIKEKSAVYEAPYQAICTELFGRGDAYGLLKGKQLIEFTTTSFIRGTTISDAIIILDEVQNLNAHECDTLITRVGENSRVIICGDMRQSDLIHNSRDKSGMGEFIKIINKMKSFDSVEFGRDDIVRSNLVKEYLLTRDDLEQARIISPLVGSHD